MGAGVSTADTVRSRGRKYQYERDVGHDYPGNDIWTGGGVPYSECEAKCDNDPNCKGFGWAGGDQWCAIKHTQGSRQSWDAPGGAYYRKYQPQHRPARVTYEGNDSNFSYGFAGTKYVGGFDGNSLQAYDQSAEDKCAAACSSNPQCKSFTFNEGSKRCQLYNEPWDPPTRPLRASLANIGAYTIFKETSTYVPLGPNKVALVGKEDIVRTVAPGQLAGASAPPVGGKRRRKR